MSEESRTDTGSSKHMLDALDALDRDMLDKLGFGGGKIKRVVVCLFTHTVSMAISYMFAELCGNSVNPIAGIWLAVASSFFLVIGGISLIEAIMIASEGMESQR